MKQLLTHRYVITVLLFLTALVVKAADTNPPEIPRTIDNPLGNVTDVPTLVRNIVSVILGIVGAIALGMFVYGGFMWMTAAGNEQRITKGRETLTWATIGLLVIFSSYAILDQIFKALTGVTQ